MAKRLAAACGDDWDCGKNVDRIIDDIQKQQGVAYAPEQRRAVALAAERGILLLTGGPGTGKTTSVRGIVTLFERMGLNVLLLAPTGRAAQRMSRAVRPRRSDGAPCAGHELERADRRGDLPQKRKRAAGGRRRHRGRNEHGGSGADGVAAAGHAARLPSCDGGRPGSAAIGRGRATCWATCCAAA